MSTGYDVCGGLLSLVARLLGSRWVTLRVSLACYCLWLGVDNMFIVFVRVGL